MCIRDRYYLISSHDPMYYLISSHDPTFYLISRHDPMYYLISSPDPMYYLISSHDPMYYLISSHAPMYCLISSHTAPIVTWHNKVTMRGAAYPPNTSLWTPLARPPCMKPSHEHFCCIQPWFKLIHQPSFRTFSSRKFLTFSLGIVINAMRLFGQLMSDSWIYHLLIIKGQKLTWAGSGLCRGIGSGRGSPPLCGVAGLAWQGWHNTIKPNQPYHSTKQKRESLSLSLWKRGKGGSLSVVFSLSLSHT